MKRLMFGVLLVGATRVCVALTDGFNSVGTYWAPTVDFATDTRYWENHRLPSDGGIAHYLGVNLNDQVFAAPVTLRGLDFGNVQEVAGHPQLLGGELVLSGDAFVAGSGRGKSDTWGRIGRVCSTVRGTGDNTLTKKGRGELIVDTPFADFGTLAVGGGRLTTTNVTGRLFATDAMLAWKGGVFRWAPALSVGESASASTGAAAYGPFGGTLMWGRGDGDSASLTLASLVRTGDGATLWLAPDGGSSALGETERLFVSEELPQVNGLLDPSLVTRDTSEASWPFSFTTYDSEKGVVPYPVASMKSLTEAGAEDVARVTEASELVASKRVAALVVDSTSQLTLGEGTTLSVGDDNASHPAGVIFNRQVTSASALAFDGAGTLDFGASPGVIWNASKNGSEYVDLKTRITGSGGVTFASRGCATATDYPATSTGKFNVYSGVGGWCGPTYVNGTVLFLRAADALPSGDIYVLNSSGLEGGELLLSGGINWRFSQNLHLAGRTNGSVDEAVLRTPDATITFNGGVYLEDDAALSSYDPNRPAIFDFRGGLFGPGVLTLPHGGMVNLYSPATISGVNGFGNVMLNVSTNGTLGTGLVWLRGGNDHRVAFTGQPGLVVDNAFRCDAGTLGLSLSFAQVTLARPSAFTSANLSTFSRLTLGADSDFGRIDAACSRDDDAGADCIVAGAGGVTLGIGDDGEDSVFAVPLADGAGALAFAKRGTCEVELAPAARTYSGATSIEAGTLRLNGDPLLSRSLLYWLDADHEDSLTKEADGMVSAWRSRGGRADVTFMAADGTSTWSANTVNGRAAVTTGASAASRLRGDKALTQNTVFIVYRIREATGHMGIFGSTDLNGGDYGVRLSDAKPSASTGWNTHRSHYNYNTTGWIRRDGGRGGPAGVGSDEAHILTLVHDRDNWPHSDSWGENTLSATFVPNLGYYAKGRYFQGDYCEVLAFDRVLTEVEMRKVENYLSEKWLAKTIWEDVGAPSFLPADTALRIDAGGTLDLAGQSLTVGSLTGGGVVTNSSAVPATLTVTGAANFTGRIGGQATLALQATSDIGAVVSEGATLAVNAGTVTAGLHRLTPPTDGLAYWCDAALTNTILCDASGGVTSWVSRAVSSAKALVNAMGVLPGAQIACARPTYAETAVDGKPGVVYEQNCRALWADKMSPVRTVFMAVRLEGSQVANAGLWGIGGKTLGYRTVSYGTSTTLASWADCYVRPSVRSDRVAMDGVDYAEAEVPLGDGVTRIFSVRLNGDAATDAAHFSNLGLGTDPACTTCVGSFDGNSSIKGAIGEVIAYDRVLSDGEMRAVEAYLKAKWQASDWVAGDEFVERENGLAEGSLSVGTGATVRVPDGARIGELSGGGGTIAGGNLTVGGVDVAVRDDGSVEKIVVAGAVRLAEDAYLRVANAERLKKNIWWPFLTATTLEGVFATHNLPKGVSLHLSANAAELLRAKGSLIIIR